MECSADRQFFLVGRCVTQQREAMNNNQMIAGSCCRQEEGDTLQETNLINHGNNYKFEGIYQAS